SCQSAVSFAVISHRLRNTLDKLVQDPPAKSAADLAERREPLLPVDGRGIGKAPVEHAPGTGEQRALFSGLIARRHDDIKRSVRDLVDALAALAGDVDADLAHHAHRFGTKAARLETRARRLIALAAESPQQALRHLRARRISDAEEEDALTVAQISGPAAARSTAAIRRSSRDARRAGRTW